MTTRTDLADYMDLVYGSGQWTYRTTPHTGSDCGVAINAAFRDMRASGGRGVLTIPTPIGGLWRFTTPPDPTLMAGHEIIGMGSQDSKVIIDADSGTFFGLTGYGGFTGGCIKGVGIFLEEDHPTATTSALVMAGDASFQPDQMEFDDLYISAEGNSYWYNGFLASGQARTAPQGIRVCDIKNVQVFKCSNVAGGFYGIDQWSIENFGVYVPKPGTIGGNVYIGGGGSEHTNTCHMDIGLLNVAGQLNLTNATYVTIENFTCDSIAAAASFNHYDLEGSSNSPLQGQLGPNGRFVLV